MADRIYHEGSIGTGHWVERLHPFLVEDGRMAMWKGVGVSPYAGKYDLMTKLGIPQERYYKIDSGSPIPRDFFNELDVIHIASYNQFHAQQTKECLMDAIPVVVEKTFAPTEEEFRDVLGFIRDGQFENMATLDVHYTEKAPTLELFGGRAFLEKNIREYGKIERVVATFFEASTIEDERRVKWLTRPEEGGIVMDWAPHPLSVLYKYCGARFGDCLGAKEIVVNPDFHSEQGTAFYAQFEMSGDNFVPKADVTIRAGKGFPKDYGYKRLRFYHRGDAYTDVGFFSTGAEMDLGRRGAFKTVETDNGKDTTVSRAEARGNVSYQNLVGVMVDLVENRLPKLSLDDVEGIFEPIWKFKEKIGVESPISEKDLVREYSMNGWAMVGAEI